MMNSFVSKSYSGMCGVRKADLTGLQRFRFYKFQRMTLFHIFEQRLSSPQKKRVDHQPELIDKTQIQQTGYCGCTAYNVNVLTRLLFEFSDFFRISNDPCRLPFNFVQRFGKDNVRRLIGEACIHNFVLGSGPSTERQEAGGVSQD